MRRAFIAAVVFSAVIISASAQDTSSKEDPTTTLWLVIKKQLTGPDGQEYYDSKLKDARMPLLVGKLVSATPADAPNTLALLMPGGKDPEVTLHVKDAKGNDDHFPGPLMLGSAISFEGTVVSFEKQPLMLVFNVSTAPRKFPSAGAQHKNPNSR